MPGTHEKGAIHNYANRADTDMSWNRWYYWVFVEITKLRGFLLGALFLARVAGFEPAHDGIRIRCLTAWRYPIA